MRLYLAVQIVPGELVGLRIDLGLDFIPRIGEHIYLGQVPKRLEVTDVLWNLPNKDPEVFTGPIALSQEEVDQLLAGGWEETNQ